MKSANYFPLDANHSNSTKSAEILMSHGHSGYGIYIHLLQKLLSSKTRKLEMAKINAIAFDMHIRPDELRPILEYFETNNLEFWSDDLNEKMTFFDEKYNKASEGGKKAQATKTPEQKSADGKKAAEARWKSIETSNTGNTQSMQRSSYKMQSDSVSDANNRIEYNRIEENRTQQKRKEEKNPSGSSRDLGLGSESLTTPSGFAPSSPSQIIDEVEKVQSTDIINRVSNTDTANKVISSDSQNVVSEHSEQADRNALPSDIDRGTSNTQQDTQGLQPIDIDKLCQEYLEKDSMFFYKDNRNIVVNLYSVYNKEYPKNQKDIWEFEEIVYVYLFSAMAWSNDYQNAIGFNLALDKTPSIVVESSQIRQLITSINNNTKGSKETYDKMIAKVIKDHNENNK